MAGSFAEMTSGAQKYIDSGSVAETQLALFLLLSADKKQDDGTFVDAGIRIAVPYIFVDNPMSYASGREDYGYPKAMGLFDPDTGLGSPMSMQAFGGNLARNSKAQWTQLVTLERVGPAGPGPSAARVGDGEERWRAPSEIVPYFLTASGGDTGAPGLMALLGELIKALLDKSARQVFLKEFRDAEVTTAACYQSIVEATFEVAEVTWRPTSNWRAKIAPLTSHPIATELGVTTQTTWKTLELLMDLHIAPGEVVAP